MIREIGRAPIPTKYGSWTYVAFSHRDKKHTAVFLGERPTDRCLVRVHSSCATSELFGAVNCDCREQLDAAMMLMHQEGAGVVVYLDQEGRGTGISGKLAQLNNMFGWENGQIVQRSDHEGPIDTVKGYQMAGLAPESRDFNVAAQILLHLGVSEVTLLTNNPRKLGFLRDAGLLVSQRELHIAPPNEIVARDLASKARDLGHTISPDQYHWSG